MGSVAKRLLAKAAVRTREVAIDGELFAVREVGAISFSAYGKLVGTDPVGATAALFAECVVGEDGQPALTLEEAKLVAASARVTLPLVRAIMDVSGFGDDEKKA